MGDTVLIGHSVGFDLAVLKRECERADIPFRPPRTLDTRLLAQVAAPNLAGYTLEELAVLARRRDRGAPFGARRRGRRRRASSWRWCPSCAMRGIRTLGEAMQACRALTDVLDAQHRAGWRRGAGPHRCRARRLGRIDSYPYRHRVRDVMRVAAAIRARRHVDWRRAGAADGGAHLLALRHPPGRTMRERSTGGRRPASSPSAMCCARCRGHGGGALDAAGRAVHEQAARGGSGGCLRLSRHRPHEPAQGPPSRRGRRDRRRVGALSARDLLRLRAGEAVSLGDEIDAANDVHALGRAWAKLPRGRRLACWRRTWRRATSRP